MELDGYYCFNLYHKFRHRNARRNSGGIAVYVRNEYRDGITLMKNEHDTIVWFKLDRMFFNTKEDIYFAAVYLWSDNSPITNIIDEDLFVCVQNDIDVFSTKGIVIIGGDCNARTACKPDFIVNDRYNCELDADDYQVEEILPRFSMDKGSNSHGNKLLELCMSTSLSIVNGRLGEDYGIGKYTCYNSHGSSVIDYILTDKDSFNSIKSFKVSEFNEFSDHAPLSLSIVCNNLPDTANIGLGVEERIKWNKDDKDAYRAGLIGLLPEFNRLVSNIDTGNENAQSVNSK